MYQNYIFTGFGHAAGKYIITNDELELAAKNNYLKGFREDKIVSGKNYKTFLEKHPGVSPFSYFAEYKMGFRSRHHVSPFPPGEKYFQNYETSLDLAVKSVDNALQDAGIHPEKIDAWFFSTVSSPEQAPGLAATAKCFFTKFSNQNPTMTIASGCSGFMLNLERALNYMMCNPEVKNIVIAHSETMSSFLWNLTHYVNFVTFGDAAAAIVISKADGEQPEGIIKIKNLQDIKMIDFVGVDKEWNLYMDDVVIKERATANIPHVSRIILDETGWKADNVDMVIPHQTGNAILHECAEKLNIPLHKLYQDVQYDYGNVSGATIPLGFSLLQKANRLKPGMKILAATAGVGGIYGAFTYVMPGKIQKTGSYDIKEDLKGKITLVTGCTGGLGFEVSKELAKRGCELILTYNSNKEKAGKLEDELKKYAINYEFLKTDFAVVTEVDNLISFVTNKYGRIDFLVHTSAISGGLVRATDVSDAKLKEVSQINQFSPVEITKRLKKLISDVILYVGSVAEEAQFTGSSPYVQSKKGLHGFAASFAYEARSSGIRSIYYMPAIISGGMTGELEEKHIAAAKMSINQYDDITKQEVAERIVKSLYVPKVLKVRDSYEGALIVRKDGYFL
ncbi:MAG: SDR family NAD(P)-dependent oxidoreductase [Bacteroidia bacterium]|nr:SDR family NAD(P)-dependent oxidoreductase [Bacteroidia bacterium]